ncbi:hypothetical protein ACVW0P_002827 [Mucilaginibacter sp. UYNi724]
MEQKLSVWSLIEQNKFEDACELADKEYAETGDLLTLRNKVYALFHLHKYIDAISLSDKLIEYRQGDSETDFHFSGIGNWIIGNERQAVADWEQSKKSLYKDAAGGVGTQVFLYFAGIKLGEEKLRFTAIKSIKNILKAKRAINWPGPIGHYLVSDINENELFSYVSDIPILKERQLCQANFVIAIKLLEGKDNHGYYRKLKDAVAYGTSAYVEKLYYLAKAELEAI